MAKYRDTAGMGRSALIPRIKDESWWQRHSRRLYVNLRHSNEVDAWCFERSVTVTITNHGHHWRFACIGGRLAEWWPSSAKLVFNRHYAEGIHCHDYSQVLKALADRWGLELTIMNRGKTDAATGTDLPVGRR